MLLFSPVKLGALALSNRVIMAPLARVRAGAAGVPDGQIIEHYTQRATTGLIVTEGVYTSLAGQSFVGQPGMVTPAQVDGWRLVADAVHAEGGLIVAQLLHGGRVTHATINGDLPAVAPSSIAIDGFLRTADGKLPFPVPHALTADQIGDVVAEFVHAARNAIDAGLDGVEIHAANGYLLHEFFSPTSNTREDAYGGTPRRRAQFGIEVLTAVAKEIGANRVGVRISPSHNIQDVLEPDDSDTRTMYHALIAGIAELGLAYLSVLHTNPAGEFVQHLRQRFAGPLVANCGFGVVNTREEAVAIVEDGNADAVAIGRPMIADPDLVRRWTEGREFTEADRNTFYGPDARGYNDHRSLHV